MDSLCELWSLWSWFPRGSCIAFQAYGLPGWQSRMPFSSPVSFGHTRSQFWPISTSGSLYQILARPLSWLGIEYVISCLKSQLVQTFQQAYWQQSLSYLAPLLRAAVRSLNYSEMILQLLCLVVAMAFIFILGRVGTCTALLALILCETEKEQTEDQTCKYNYYG